MLLRLAWRNLWRNRRRTIINLVSAGLGLFLVLVYGGLIGGILSEAKEQLDDAALGHVELAAPGWHARRQIAATIPKPADLVEKLRLPADSEVSARVVFRALASSAHGAQGIVVHGVEPAAERLVAGYLRDLRTGALLEGTDDRGVVIGEQLADRLHVTVGSKLRVMAQRADGEVGADLFRVRGIFHAVSPALSRSQVVLTMAAAQRLAGLGDVVHQIVVQLPEAALADEIAANARAALGPSVAVLTWAQLLPILKSMDDLVGVVQLVIGLFIYLLVGLGILNTMLMSVLERTRELGVLRALGTRPAGIVRLVAAESFWIATLAVGAGLGLGIPLVWLGETNALIDFSKAMGEGMELGGTTLRSAFHTKLSLSGAAGSALIVYVVTLCAGLWPAWRVSRLQPASALRAT